MEIVTGTRLSPENIEDQISFRNNLEGGEKIYEGDAPYSEEGGAWEKSGKWQHESDLLTDPTPRRNTEMEVPRSKRRRRK